MLIPSPRISWCITGMDNRYVSQDLRGGIKGYFVIRVGTYGCFQGNETSSRYAYVVLLYLHICVAWTGREYQKCIVIL